MTVSISLTLERQQSDSQHSVASPCSAAQAAVGEVQRIASEAAAARRTAFAVAVAGRTASRAAGRTASGAAGRTASGAADRTASAVEALASMSQ